VGLHLGYQNLHGLPDVQTFMQETNLAVEAEAMGFDYVGPVEHHFTDYAACPDPFQVLSYIGRHCIDGDALRAELEPRAQRAQPEIKRARPTGR